MSRYKRYTKKEIEKMAKHNNALDELINIPYNYRYDFVETEYFDSVYGMVETLGERDVSKLSRNSWRESPLCKGCTKTVWEKSYDGFSNADNLREQLRDGIPLYEAKEQQSHLRDVLTETETARGPVKYGPAGGSVNVPRHLIGIPAMRRRPPQERRSKVINLGIDGTFPYDVEKREIEKAGAYIMEAVLILQRSGYRIGLTHLCSVHDHDRLRIMGVRIKAPEAPLDIRTVQWWLTSPAALRGADFSWMCSSPDIKRKEVEGCLGSVLKAQHQAALAELLTPGSVFLSTNVLIQQMIRKGRTPEQCRNWVIAQITGTPSEE